MLSDLSVGERSGRVIVRSGKGNEARTVPLNASARLALAVYLAPQWEFVEKKYRDPIYTQRSAHFAVIWYVVSFRQKYTDRPAVLPAPAFQVRASSLYGRRAVSRRGGIKAEPR